MGGHTPQFEDKFKNKIIDVADLPEQNVLSQFSSSNSWIRNAMQSGGNVLVHW